MEYVFQPDREPFVTSRLYAIGAAPRVAAPVFHCVGPFSANAGKGCAGRRGKSGSLFLVLGIITDGIGIFDQLAEAVGEE